MALYFFHLKNGEGCVTDESGLELPDLGAARRHGVKALGQIAADELACGVEKLHVTIMVDDAAGERLLTLPLSLSIAG